MSTSRPSASSSCSRRHRATVPRRRLYAPRGPVDSAARYRVDGAGMPYAAHWLAPCATGPSAAPPRPRPVRREPRPRRRAPLGGLRRRAAARPPHVRPRPDHRGQRPGAAPAISSRGELAGRGLDFRPHFWLSDEWFCPDGVPGIAIPFYLAHPAPGPPRAEADARGRGRHPRSGACASCATRPATPSRTPTACGSAAGAGELFGRTLRALSRSSTCRALQPELRDPPRRLVRAEPSRRGLRGDLRGLARPRTPTGARATRAGPPCASSSTWTTLMRELAGAAAAGAARRARLDAAVAHAARRCASTTASKRRALRPRPPALLRPRPAAAVLRRRPATRDSPTAAALPLAHPAASAPARGALDRRVPVHDRPGAEGHHRALPRAGLRLPRSEEETRAGVHVLLTVQTMNYLHSGRHRVAL